MDNAVDAKRVATGIAVIGFSIFAIFDFLVAPEYIGQLLRYRFLFAIPALVLCYLLSYWSWLAKRDQILSLLIGLVCSINAVLAINVFAETDLRHASYFTGLGMILIFAPLLMEFKPVTSILFFLTTILVFNILQLERGGTEIFWSKTYYGSNFYLLATAGLVILARERMRAVYKQKIAFQRALMREKNRLDEAQQKLLHEMTLKDRILAIISHDIRGPMANVRNLVRISDFYDASSDQQVELKKKVLHSVDGTISLLDNILDWSKTQINGVTINWSSIEIEAMAQGIVASLRTISTAKGIEIIFSNKSKADAKMIFSDASILSLVIRNLLTNAIKFTTRGTIELVVEVEDRKLKVSVIDSGVGVPADQISQLFSNAKRIQKSIGTAGEKGTGIGLLLCKDYLEKIQGRLFYRPNPTGGSVFGFEVPLDGRSGRLL